MGQGGFGGFTIYNDCIILLLMELEFDDRIPQARREYDKILDAKEKADVFAILQKITRYGLQNISPTMAKHLWGDVYEIKPRNKRVIYVQIDNNLGKIIKVYQKQGQKMPKQVKNNIIKRRNKLD